MAIPNRYILYQAPVLAALGKTVVSSLAKRGTSAAPELPGPEIVETIPPRPAELVRSYIRHVGGEPSSYRGILPPHLFPQWGFALASRTLLGVDYPLQKVLNAGCRMDIRAPLPADQPLIVRVRLESIDDDGRRALIKQRVVTGTESVPDALVSHMFALVPLGEGRDSKDGKSGAPKKKKEPIRVPEDARELGFWRLRADAGLDFAKLTGDFNPVHWIPPYARAMGFRNTILHGFSTMARAIEGVQRGMFAGSTRALKVFDCKFTRPLVLPAKVGLYVRGDGEVFVGDAPGGPAYLVGSFTTRDAAS
jgi:acyl dehydratase